MSDLMGALVHLKFPLSITGDGDATSIRDDDGNIIAQADWDGVASGEGGINDQLAAICELANAAYDARAK